MRGDQQKYIFRKLAERVGVPKEVLYRKKQGFALPLVHWMRNELKPMILDVLLDRRTLERGYFSEKGLRRLLDEHFKQRRDHSARIWRFLMFELWHRNFLDRLGSRAPASDTLAAVSGLSG
jgi:asparagine synthase (glutamine-hydrolysing)